ncbi:NAD-dependent epimerase/dehydratase family protein [Agaribacterium sp. ZY112]|uniref:NAD-dependent epimerase/dehydratase family protein n=1 Tax=Agaribacterium sp. ZY112 TaxID=3233574 RepID=UPI003523CC8F
MERNLSKVLVVGRNGVVAKHLLRMRDDFLSTSTQDGADYRFELANPRDFDYSEFGVGDTVIFTAAISSPDRCSREYDFAYRINVVGTKYAISRFLERGVKVLFFSSDVVYGESESVVDEESTTNPFGEYAAMKEEVERQFAGNPLFKILRLSYVISSLDSFVQYVVSCIKSGEEAEVFYPLSRKVIDVEDVVEATIRIVEDWDAYKYPVLNLCGEVDVQREEIAQLIDSSSQSAERLKYRCVDLPEGFWDSRPKIINVESRHLSSLLGRKPRSIEYTCKNIMLEYS